MSQEKNQANGYSCDGIILFRKLNFLFTEAVLDLYADEHLILLPFLFVNSLLVPCWRERHLSDNSLKYKIFLLLYNLKITSCIFCNTVSCHDKHWNSMLNKCLYFNNQLEKTGLFLPLYDYSFKGKLLILYCVIFFLTKQVSLFYIKTVGQKIMCSRKFALLFSFKKYFNMSYLLT